MRRPAAPIVGLLAVLGGGCGGANSAGDEPRPRNALLIVVDTLRADHLGLYGYARDTSPTLERLAISAVVFERAWSQASCTFPSVNSLLTSRPPDEFLGRGFDMSIPRGVDSLATVLQRAGFATFAASASPVVRATPSRINKVGGFGQGFDRFDETCESRDASCLNARLAEFLAEGREPFFAYVHLMDPHHPYQPPAAHARRFAIRLADTPWVRQGNPDPIEWRATHGLPARVDPADLRGLVDLYDEEIAYLDGQLGRLFAMLDARGLRERTLVVLAADHGEMFLEHGDVKHCRQVYDTVVHTPLAVWVPGRRPGHRVGVPVENLDIAPTVLDHLGMDVPPTFVGRSLRPLVEGRPAAGRHAHTVMGTRYGVTDGRWTLVRDLGTGEEWLFDVLQDRGEQRDRAPDAPAERARLAGEADAWVAAHEPPRTPEARRQKAEGLQQRLRELGYLE